MAILFSTETKRFMCNAFNRIVHFIIMQKQRLLYINYNYSLQCGMNKYILLKHAITARKIFIVLKYQSVKKPNERYTNFLVSIDVFKSSKVLVCVHFFFGNEKRGHEQKTIFLNGNSYLCFGAKTVNIHLTQQRNKVTNVLLKSHCISFANNFSSYANIFVFQLS